MGWETRRNGRRYYYRKERTADGVRSVYCGAGDVARLYASSAEILADDREIDRLRRRSTFGPIDDALAALRQTQAELRALSGAYLVATGHRTHRGQWRRRRDVTLPPLHLAAAPPASAPPPEPMAKKKTAPKKAAEPWRPGCSISTEYGRAFTVPDGTPELVQAELADAYAGLDTRDPDPMAVSRFRDALACLPADAFRPFSARQALRKAASITADGVPVALMEAEAERFAAELAEPEDGPLVRAACETAALARLVHEQAATVYARTIKGNYLLKTAEHLEKRMDATHTRYLRALATAAKLRDVERKERRRAELHAERETPPARPALTLDAFFPRPSTDAPARQLPAHAGDGLPKPEDVELVG